MHLLLQFQSHCIQYGVLSIVTVLSDFYCIKRWCPSLFNGTRGCTGRPACRGWSSAATGGLTLRCIFKCYQHTVDPLPGGGFVHKKAWPRSETHYNSPPGPISVDISQRNRQSSARALAGDFQRPTGVRVCNQTVRNRLHEDGMHARRLATGPILTPAHWRARLEFARDHGNWQIGPQLSLLM